MTQPLVFVKRLLRPPEADEQNRHNRPPIWHWYSRVRRLALWLAPFAGLAVLVPIYYGEIQRHEDPDKDGSAGTDFVVFYLSGHNLLRGDSIYRRHTWPLEPANLPRSALLRGNAGAPEEAVRSPAHHQQHNNSNLNPPVFSVLTAPLARLPYSTAWWVWSVASVLSGILSLALLLRAGVLNGRCSPPTAALIVVGFCGYFPTFANIRYGQVSLFLLLPVTLGWLALRQGSNFTAGLWLGFAASVKPFAALFLVVLTLRRNWSAVIAFLTIALCAFAVGGLVAGFEAYAEYQAVLKASKWFSASWNASFAGFFYRLFAGCRAMPLAHVAKAANWFTIVCSLLVLAMVAHTPSRPPGHDPTQSTDALFALTIPAMLLISPLGWMYYFPLLLLNFVVVWSMANGAAAARSARVVLALLVASTTIPTALVKHHVFLVERSLWLSISSANYFFSLLFIFALTHYLCTKDS